MTDGEDGPAAPPLPPGRFYRLAWSFYLGLAIAAVLWLGLRHGPLPVGLFFDLGSLPLDLALGVATGGVAIGVWRLGRRRVAAMADLEARIRELLGGLGRDEALALALVSGFAEELFFRGAMQDAWGPYWATAVFAALHTGPGRAFRTWTLFALAVGGALAALTVWRGNLLPAVVAHVLVNAVNLRSLLPVRETPET